MAKRSKQPPVPRRANIVNDPERAHRASLARAEPDEFRRTVTSMLAGLVDRVIVKGVLDPAWSGERFWL